MLQDTVRFSKLYLATSELSSELNLAFGDYPYPTTNMSGEAFTTPTPPTNCPPSSTTSTNINELPGTWSLHGWCKNSSSWWGKLCFSVMCFPLFTCVGFRLPSLTHSRRQVCVCLTWPRIVCLSLTCQVTVVSQILQLIQNQNPQQLHCCTAITQQTR